MTIDNIPAPILATSRDPDTARLKTEGGSTAFAQAKRFRAFDEFTLNDGDELIIKIETPINVTITGLVLNMDSGGVRYEAIFGPTESTPFNTVIPFYRINTRNDAPINNAQLIASKGGTIAGGTVVDVATVRTSTQNQRNSLLEQAQTVRGIPPSIYYIRLTGTINGSAGILYANWEEI